MEESARVCPKDCRMCSMQQQVFCSAQMSFNMFEVMSNVLSRIEELEKKVGSIGVGGELMNPLRSQTKTITQMGSGVE